MTTAQAAFWNTHEDLIAISPADSYDEHARLEAWAEVYDDLEAEAALWAARDTATGRWLSLLAGRGPEYAARLNALLDAFPEIPVSELAWRPEAVTYVIRLTLTA